MTSCCHDCDRCAEARKAGGECPLQWEDGICTFVYIEEGDE